MANRFIFWQNINSIHQSAFLRALSKRFEVVLVTAESSTGREHMGWKEPVLPGVRHVRMSDGQWDSLIRADDGVEDCHVFAGLHAFPLIHHAFQLAVDRGCRIGIYSEPLVRRGISGWMKDLRGRLDSFRYGKAIEFVLCIGPEAKRQFIEWGFSPNSLHSWAYVTENVVQVQSSITTSPNIQVVFPASLIPRKGADILIQALASMRHRDALHVDAFSIDPSGIDAWQASLLRKAERLGNISVLPYIDNHELLCRLSTYDYMVLPSRHDGWGAAVNEALMAGIPAIVSKRCGSSILLTDNPILGTLTEPDPIQLAACLDACIEAGRPDIEKRRAIRAWALQNISGKALADYFLSIVASSPDNRLPPAAPWEKYASMPIIKSNSSVD